MIYLVDLYAGDYNSYDTLEELTEDIRERPDSFGPACRYAIFRGYLVNVEKVFEQANKG